MSGTGLNSEVQLVLRWLETVGRFRLPRQKWIHFQGWTIHYLDYPSLLLVLREIFLDRDYRFECASESPFIVDCGSNIGVALLYFKRLYPGARILAFEPDPETFSVLCRNVEANRLSNVDARNAALSGHHGPVEFFRDPHRKGALYMSTDRRIVQAISRDGSSNQTTVPGVRLSSCLEQPVDFLKLDAEGAEHDILQELAEQGKLGLVRQMVMEYHHFPSGSRLPDTLQLLHGHGFVFQIRASLPARQEAAALQTLLIRAWQP